MSTSLLKSSVVFGVMKWTCLLMVAGVATGLSISCGSEFISPGDWTAAENVIIIKLRLLRSINCFCIGGALAMSGAACQAVLRNPLAEPYILGVSGGAGVGAALAFLTGAAALSIYSIALFSFAGAVAALLLAIAMGGMFVGAGGVRSDNILLSGVVIGALASSLLMFVISTLNFNELGGITFWLMGDVQCGSIALLRALATIFVLGGIGLWLLGNQVDLLALDDNFAHYSGVDVRHVTLAVLLLTALLAGGAVASGGMIGFVGLMVPHILRKIFGPGHRNLFLLSALGGGAFLLLCDVAGRSLLEAREIPVGIICAFLGGPFFLWLLRCRVRRGR